ncbi:MAG: hypothetical protein P4N59_13810 [Negativicutes bacterium]|nr:hypothetical protein [Negativicutes bacterium]
MKKRSFSVYLAIGSLLMAIMFGLIQPGAVQAAAPATTTANAYEVIQFGSHDTIVREISFTAASITGMAALNLTGLHVVTQASTFGPFVCSINGVGDCSGTAPYYWAYYQWDSTGSDWKSSSEGAGSTTVSDGAAEGWVYTSYADYGSPPNLPSAQRAEAAAGAAAWLQTQQSASTGGYDSIGDSAEALLAVGSDGYPASSWIRKGGSHSLEGYWMSNGAAYARTGGDSAGKLAVGMQAACACWPSSAPHPSAFYNATSGLYSGAHGTGAGPQAWAILGSLSLRDSVPSLAVTTLEGMAQSDGGWEWQPGFGSDTNTTALVVQALLATGVDSGSTLITNALAYIKSLQQNDGGIFYDNSIYTTASDVDSSAYAIMAIQTAGGDPTGSDWTKNGNTPISYLLNLQLSNGSFPYQAGPTANLLATSQTISALLGNDYLLNANFSISGKVTSGKPATGLVGVKVALGSYNATTASDGTYTITSIPAGAKGSLSASLAGYNFAPASVTIPAMTGTLGGKNFVATPTSYMISGKVTVKGKALKGVTLQTTYGSSLSMPNVTTNSNGDYTIGNLAYNTVYTVTPVLAGYTFAPPNFVSPAMSSNQTANFAATLQYETISGTVSGLGGVIIKIGYGSGKSQLVSTDNTGFYSISLPENVGYTLTPISPIAPPDLFRFAPTFISIPAGNGNATANFAATPQVVMSGTVTVQGKGVKGVTVSAAGFNTLTDSHGHYYLEVPNNTSMTPTATHPFFTFTDVVSPITPSGNFTQPWSHAEVNISGNVTLNGAGLPGVVLTVNAAKGKTPLSTTTDDSGAYSLTVHDTDTPNLASFTLTPALSYFTFSPKSQTFSSSGGVVKNFVAGIPKWNVSGMVTIDSKGLSGVEIDATINGAPIKVITDSSGAYTINGVPRNASISLSARKYGYTFSSGNISVIMGQADVQGQDFSATALPLDKSISGTIVLNGTTNPLAGVVVSLSYQGAPIFTTKTAKDGSYSFLNLFADSGYVVTPKLSKYSFTPPNRAVDLSTSSATEQDLSATHVK